MKVILQKPVDALGDPGDTAEVADGYARNYLIPRGLAIKAEKGGLKHAESLKRSHVSRLGRQKVEFEATASRLIAAGPVEIEARAGEEGRLFGSVTAADVAEAVTARSGIEVDRKDVHLDEPIRSVGTHEVRVKLFHEVEPILTVEVVAAGE
jgi:large subunit ribosomal protein L9